MKLGARDRFHLFLGGILERAPKPMDIIEISEMAFQAINRLFSAYLFIWRLTLKSMMGIHWRRLRSGV